MIFAWLASYYSCPDPFSCVTATRPDPKEKEVVREKDKRMKRRGKKRRWQQTSWYIWSRVVVPCSRKAGIPIIVDVHCALRRRGGADGPRSRGKRDLNKNENWRRVELRR